MAESTRHHTFGKVPSRTAVIAGCIIEEEVGDSIVRLTYPSQIDSALRRLRARNATVNLAALAAELATHVDDPDLNLALALREERR